MINNATCRSSLLHTCCELIAQSAANDNSSQSSTVSRKPAISCELTGPRLSGIGIRWPVAAFNFVNIDGVPLLQSRYRRPAPRQPSPARTPQ